MTTETKRAASSSLKPESILPSVGTICEALQHLQRERSVIIKSRNMQANRLQAIVAGCLGYSSSMEEKERQKKFAEATEAIKRVADGDDNVPMANVIRVTLVGIEAFNEIKVSLEKKMLEQAKLLPVADWVSKPEQRGFGLLFLAIVIGETGDLTNYSNPAKVWKRLGCAPWSFDGKTAMGATWRAGKEGKLTADEWSKFGYSPRRRSIAYLIGEGIVKQNFVRGGDGDGPIEIGIPDAGPYRERYLQAKAKAAEERPEWTACSTCKGGGKTKTAKKCSVCKGTGKVMKRCHLHGMLLATKLLLKELWLEWHGHPPKREGQL